MDSKATRAIKLLLLLALFAGAARAQNSPYSDIVISAAGRPIAGAGISVCNSPGLATTAASVSSNLVTLTMASNPITAGFAANMTLQVSGFTGGDTYLNGGTLSGGVITGGFTILSVTSTTIVYQLSHANASATSNGSAFQQGNISTPCAPLASITSDGAGLQPITQPGLASDNLGNYAFFAAANSYVIQFNGAGVFVRLKPIAASCSGTVTCTFTAPQSFTNLTVSGTLSAPAASNLNNIRFVDGVTYTTIQAAITSCPGPTTQCTVVVPNTYAGADPVACPTVNITVWDLRSQTFSTNPVHYGFNVWDGCPNSKWASVNTGGLARAKHYIGYTAASNAIPGETAETVVLNATANQWPAGSGPGNVQEALATITQVNTGTDTLTNASTAFPNTISTHEFFASPVGTGLLLNDMRASTGSIASGSGSAQIGYAAVYDAVVGPLLAAHHVAHYVGLHGNDPFAGGIPTLSLSGNAGVANGQPGITWSSGDKFAPNSMPTFPIVLGGVTYIVSSCASSIACTLSTNYTAATGTVAYTFAGYAYGLECIGSCRLSAVSGGTNTDPHGGGGNLFDTAAGGSANVNKNWFRDTSSQLADGTFDRGSFEFHGTASGNACFDGTSGWVFQSRTPTKVACMNAAGTMQAGVYCNNVNGTGCITPPASGSLTSPIAAGTGRLAQIVASGTSTMAAGAITAATCATAITSTATGAATTDAIEWAYATAPTLTTDALLHISPYVTSGNVNFTRCNPTAGSITGTAIVINWSVIR